jgi:hypothetical protein
MRRPDVKTPAVGAAGAKGHTKDDAENCNAHGPNACQCRINKSGCLVCRRWDKRIRGIDARRADPLRRQNMGDLMRAGG